MSIKSHFITHKETHTVQGALRALGYRVTAGQCYDYVLNLGTRLEPMDIAARRRIEQAIEEALYGEQGAPHA